MDNDLMLTLGIILILLIIPSLLAAWVDGRAPRVGAVVLVIAAAMILTAISRTPGGYSFGDIPGVMMNVFSRYTG
ncbi:MAG: hypothetical protein HC844_04240 [Tabrizicola sp.]|nr:hypothetical protein [Tabrizicola sp.]